MVKGMKKAHYFRSVGNNVLFNFSWCQSVQAAPVSARLLRYSILRIRCAAPPSIRGLFPSVKNCAKVIPNALQTASKVGSVGALFRLNIFVTVEWERLDSFANR